MQRASTYMYVTEEFLSKDPITETRSSLLYTAVRVYAIYSFSRYALYYRRQLRNSMKIILVYVGTFRRWDFTDRATPDSQDSFNFCRIISLIFDFQPFSNFLVTVMLFQRS